MGLILEALQRLEAGAEKAAMILTLPTVQDEFAFPLLPRKRPPSPPAEPQLIAWPATACTETIQACADVALSICRRLSSAHGTVLAITSPGDGEGKTDLLLALAPELARQTAAPVLVVDADFSSAELSGKLALPPPERHEDGIAAHSTEVPNLSVLSMPAYEGLHPDCKGHWIERLQESWPLVLLDTASLTHAEISPLMRHCDGVYLVVRIGRTSRRAIGEAADAIHARGASLVGCMAISPIGQNVA